MSAMTVKVMMMTLIFNEMLTMTFTLGSDEKKKRSLWQLE
jgi:hypothetical protein